MITENGTYEVTGNQPVPGAGIVDYEAMARGAGIERVCTIDDDHVFDEKLPSHFEAKGPLVFIWKIARAAEPVPRPALPIRTRARRLRQALVGNDRGR